MPILILPTSPHLRESIASQRRARSSGPPAAWLALALTLILQPTARPQSNLLLDPGFESNGAGWSVAAWQGPPTVQVSWTIDNTVSYSGTASARVQCTDPNDAQWQQTVTVQPNTRYRISGRIRTENVAHSNQAIDAGANLCVYGTWSRTEPLFGTQPWTLVTLDYITGPAETTLILGARVGFWSGITTGTAWFDDLQLQANPINTPPTITTIPPQQINHGQTSDPIPFTVSDPQTPGENLAVTATSSNQGLVQDGNIELGGFANNRTVRFTANPNVLGNVTITLTVSDGVFTESTSFQVNVFGIVNNPPILSLSSGFPGARLGSSPAGVDPALSGNPCAAGATQTAWFLLQVPWTGLTSIALQGDAHPASISIYRDNILDPPSLIACTNLPPPTAANRALVHASTTTPYFAVVTASSPVGNDIQLVPRRATHSGVPFQPVIFAASDNETAPGSLQVTVSTRNPELLESVQVQYLGGTQFQIQLLPRPGASGVGTVDVQVLDGSFAEASDSFEVAVLPAPQPPTLSNIQDLSLIENTVSATIPFTVDDADTPLNQLVITATSSQPNLIPNSAIAIGGAGRDRTLTVNPVIGRRGTTLIAVTVSDGALTASDTFQISVVPPPTGLAILSIPDHATDEDVLPDPIIIPFASSLGVGGTGLNVSASSDNQALLPNSNIVLEGIGLQRTLRLTPVPDGFGVVRITIQASQSGLSAIQSFNLTVRPVNDPPTWSPILGRVFQEDQTTGAIGFTVGDKETPASALVLAAFSNNPSLIPDDRIVFGGSHSNRTVSVSATPNRSGAAQVTVTLSDGGFTLTNQFTITVVEVPDSPSLAVIDDRRMNQDSTSPPIALGIADPDTPLDALGISVTSNNNLLFPPDGLILHIQPPTTATLTLRPAPGRFGVAQLTVTLLDGGFRVERRFLVTVQSVSAGALESRIRPPSRPSNGAFGFSWETIPGARYHIESRPTLNDPWTFLAGPFQANSGSINFSDIYDGTANRFYRVVRHP